MSKKLIIFADYGLDDAAATASVFKHADLFESIAIVPIGGNVPPDISLVNCITLLNKLNVREHGITVVDTSDVPQPFEYLAAIHGNDGMGDIFEPDANKDKLGIISFEKWLGTLKGDEVLLSLGPMTLVKKVLEKYPKCELVLMGGCIDEEPNFNGYEFNHALDTQAFSYCTKFPHVAITLDTCRTEKLDIRGLQITGDDIHSQILRADQRLDLTRGESGCYVWDDVAVCYLLHPERFKTDEKKDSYGNLVTQAEYISNEKYFE